MGKLPIHEKGSSAELTDFDYDLQISSTRTEHTIVAIINITPSIVFLTTFIMALTKNNFGIQYILNCREKVGLLKIWELLKESGRVSSNNNNLKKLKFVHRTELRSQNLNFKVVHVRCINYPIDIFAFFSILNYPIFASSYM